MREVERICNEQIDCKAGIKLFKYKIEILVYKSGENLIRTDLILVLKHSTRAFEVHAQECELNEAMALCQREFLP